MIPPDEISMVSECKHFTQASAQRLLFVFVGLRLWHWSGESLREAGAAQWMRAVVCDEVVQVVEGEVVDQIILGLAALLLRPNATVLRTFVLPVRKTK